MSNVKIGREGSDGGKMDSFTTFLEKVFYMDGKGQILAGYQNTTTMYECIRNITFFHITNSKKTVVSNKQNKIFLLVNFPSPRQPAHEFSI